MIIGLAALANAHWSASIGKYVDTLRLYELRLHLQKLLWSMAIWLMMSWLCHAAAVLVNNCSFIRIELYLLHLPLYFGCIETWYLLALIIHNPLTTRLIEFMGWEDMFPLPTVLSFGGWAFCYNLKLELSCSVSCVALITQLVELWWLFISMRVCSMQ